MKIWIILFLLLTSCETTEALREAQQANLLAGECVEVLKENVSEIIRLRAENRILRARLGISLTAEIK